MRGVDLQVGMIDDCRQQQLLVTNRLGQRTAFVGQRVAPTGFGEALEQGFVVGIQIQHVALNMPGANFFEQFGETLELAGQVARVDRHGNLRVQQFGVQQGALGKLGQQASGQVVDAVEPVVFEYVQRGALAEPERPLTMISRICTPSR